MAPIGWKSPLSKTFQVKGTSYHWDMMVVGILHYSRETGSKCIFRKVGCLNVLLSLLCLPWMHAVLPHSPLHVSSIIELNWTSIANRALVFVCFSFCCHFRICFVRSVHLQTSTSTLRKGMSTTSLSRLPLTPDPVTCDQSYFFSDQNLLDNPSEGLKNPVKPKKAQQRLYWRQKTSFYDAKPQDIW